MEYMEDNSFKSLISIGVSTPPVSYGTFEARTEAYAPLSSADLSASINVTEILDPDAFPPCISLLKCSEKLTWLERGRFCIEVILALRPNMTKWFQ